MKAEEDKRRWLDLIKSFETLLSIPVAIIEVLVIFSYVKEWLSVQMAIFLGILVIVVFLAIIVIKQRRSIKVFEAREGVRQLFPSLRTWLDSIRSEQCKGAIDSCLNYDLVKWRFIIDGVDATYIYHVRGTNSSKSSVGNIPFSCCGETMIDDDKKVEIIAEKNPDTKASEIISPVPVYSGLNFKTFHAPLKPAIRKERGKFNLRFTSRWPGTFTSKYEYVFIPLSHYRKGVKKIIAEISLTSRPKDCSVWTWDIKKHKLEVLEEELKRCRKRGQRYEIRWERSRPDRSKVYIIRFVRTDM